MGDVSRSRSSAVAASDGLEGQLVRVEPIDPAPLIGQQFSELADLRRKRQIGHDIRHEIGTLMLLASVLISSKDIGPGSRLRAQQILQEARWLDELLRAYTALLDQNELSADVIRLDEIAADVVRPIRLSSSTSITVQGPEVWAHANRLAFWRALRNMVVNAVEAAGPDGTVAVRIACMDSAAVIEVEDDGPGFDPWRQSVTSMGLAIVDELISALGGRLEIRASSLGGCCVRISLPAVARRHLTNEQDVECAS